MSVKKRRRRQKKRTGIDQATANKIRFEKEVETLTNEVLNNPDYCPLLENSDYLLEYYPDIFRDLDNIKELVEYWRTTANCLSTTRAPDNNGSPVIASDDQAYSTIKTDSR